MHQFEPMTLNYLLNFPSKHLGSLLKKLLQYRKVYFKHRLKQKVAKFIDLKCNLREKHFVFTYHIPHIDKMR
jgi:hypothetical protein